MRLANQSQCLLKIASIFIWMVSSVPADNIEDSIYNGNDDSISPNAKAVSSKTIISSDTAHIIRKPIESRTHIEASLSLGLPYIGMVGVTILPTRHLYVQVQAASSLFFNEGALLGGIQFESSGFHRWKYRLGMGCIKGFDMVPPFVLDQWQGIVYQTEVLYYFIPYFAITFAFQLARQNIISSSLVGDAGLISNSDDLIPAVNVGFIVGL